MECFHCPGQGLRGYELQKHGKENPLDIFKELTFKETSVTTANFRRADFHFI